MRRFDRLLTGYVAHLKRLHRSASTVAAAQRVLPRFFLHLRQDGITDVRAATEANITSYVRNLQRAKTRKGKPLAPWSQRAYLVPVRCFFAYLEKSGVILSDPACEVFLSRMTTLPPRVPSPSLIERLIAIPDDTAMGLRDRAIIEVLYGAGLRLSECARLDIRDVDIAQGTLLVRNGKGRKDRWVPLGGRARMALQAYLIKGRGLLLREGREQALLLASDSGRRLSRVSIEVRIRQYGRRVGLRLTPHGLRHACATHLLQGGADIRHIQELLGHRSPETTQIYTHVESRDLRDLLIRAHPRERRTTRRIKSKLQP